MKTLVTFKIGRGGRFNNAGHLSVLEFNSKINSYLEEEFFERDGVWNDAQGNSLELKVDNDGTGIAEIDGEYNTIYVKELINCDNKEISIIWDDNYGYDSYLESLNIKDFEVLRAFNIKSQDVFWSDNISDTCDAGSNGIEEVSEEEYYNDEVGYTYKEVNGKFYRKED